MRAACGAIWGLGVSISLTLFLYLLSTSTYASIFIVLVLGPLIGIGAIVAGIVIYRLSARKSLRTTTRSSLAIALVGALVLVAIPHSAQIIQLHWIASQDIPTYPGAERLATLIHTGPNAKIAVRMHTTAGKQEVMPFYENLWRQRGWSTHLDPTFSLEATRSGQTMLMVLHEPSGEIQTSWFRTYASH